MRYFEVVEQQKQSEQKRAEQNKSDIIKPKKKNVVSKNLYNKRKRILNRSKTPFAVVSKYERASKLDTRTIKGKVNAERFRKKQKDISYAVKFAARAEILNVEESGYVQTDENEDTINLTQQDILEQVDYLTTQKAFSLTLDQFGPYRVNFTRNGRHLLIAGKLGHVAAFDWQTKKLHTEINVMETVRDAKWLHLETFFAVAQKKWTYVYDNQGIEIHCLKSLDRVLKLEFLPYHFLLTSINWAGFLHYLDVSTGKTVNNIRTGFGFTDVMAHDPTNGIVALGHKHGVVSMWSPNMQTPTVKMLCHRNPIRSIAIDVTGTYLATSGTEPNAKIWDLRNLKLLKNYRVRFSPTDLSYSQKGLLSVTMGRNVAILKSFSPELDNPFYMYHREVDSVLNCQFCPFEDILGVGHVQGITTLIIPGSGEPNIDSYEANPYQSKQQRRQWEVKALLDKVQPDLISRDPEKLAEVDVKSLYEMMEEKKKLLFLKPNKISFTPRYKMKGRSKAGRKEIRKRAVREAAITEFLKSKRAEKTQCEESKRVHTTNKKKTSVLDRFIN